MCNTWDLSRIDEYTFTNSEVIVFTDETEECSARLTAENIAHIPSDTRDVTALRRKLSEYFYMKLDKSYSKLEALCDIKRDTFQKIFGRRRIAHGRGNGRGTLQHMQVCHPAGLFHGRAEHRNLPCLSVTVAVDIKQAGAYISALCVNHFSIPGNKNIAAGNDLAATHKDNAVFHYMVRKHKLTVYDCFHRSTSYATLCGFLNWIVAHPMDYAR
jgi:hypothetical protein